MLYIAKRDRLQYPSLQFVLLDKVITVCDCGRDTVVSLVTDVLVPSAHLSKTKTMILPLQITILLLRR